MADTVIVMQPMKRWNNDRLVAFTIEATDVEKSDARICSAAMAVVGGGQDSDLYDWLINPGVPIPKASSNVHGITSEHAQEHGQKPAEALDEITDLLADYVNQGSPVVVFTAPFHLTVLRYETDRYDLEPLEHKIHRNVQMLVVDPAVIDRKIDPYRRGRRTLPALCEVYHVPLPESRTATAKAMMSARLAWRIGQRDDLGTMDLMDLHDRQREWAAEQAADLQSYFQRTGRDDVVPGDWPVIEVTDTVEVTA